jgi:hypothetical protein
VRAFDYFLSDLGKIWKVNFEKALISFTTNRWPLQNRTTQQQAGALLLSIQYLNQDQTYNPQYTDGVPVYPESKARPIEAPVPINIPFPYQVQAQPHQGPMLSEPLLPKPYEPPQYVPSIPQPKQQPSSFPVNSPNLPGYDFRPNVHTSADSKINDGGKINADFSYPQTSEDTSASGDPSIFQFDPGL